MLKNHLFMDLVKYHLSSKLEDESCTSCSTSDPLFTDAANDDYTLQSGSPALDVGSSTYAPATDINGNSRPSGLGDDLGCYETIVNTWDGSTSTAWNVGANWSSGSVPGSSDDVIIANVSNDPVVSSSSDVCGTLTIVSGAVLTINNGSYKLTASSVDLQSGGTINISNGELESTGKFDHDGGLTISGGTLDINGEYESSASSTESISGGTITCAGEWDGANDDAFTPTGGTVTMDGTSNKNLAQHASSNFYNLTIGNSSGDVDVTAALNVDGDLTISSGGDLDIGSSGINLNLAGSFANSGTLTISGETITFDGTGTETSAAINDASAIVYVSKSSGSVTTTGDFTIDELRVTSGTLIIDGETVDADDRLVLSGGTIQITSGTLATDYDDSNYGTISGGTLDVDGGTVNFGTTSTQYADLEMSSGELNVSGGTVNISDELDVADGTITITGGTINIGTYTGSSNGSDADRFEVDAGTLNLTGGTINIYGQYAATDVEALDLASAITVNANANNTINIEDGSGSSDENMYIISGGKQLGSMTIANTSNVVYTDYSDFDFKGDLTISSGTTLNIDYRDDHIDIEGDLTVTGTLDATGEEITFDGSGAQTVSGISGNDAIMYVSKSGGTLTTTGNLSLDELRVTAGTMLVDGEDVTVDDQLVVSGGTLQMTSGLIHNSYDGETTTISGGTLDVDGGELRIGDLVSDNNADIKHVFRNVRYFWWYSQYM